MDRFVQESGCVTRKKEHNTSSNNHRPTKAAALLSEYCQSAGVRPSDLFQLLGGEGSGWAQSSVYKYLRGERTLTARFLYQVGKQLELSEEQKNALINAVASDVWLGFMEEYYEVQREDQKRAANQRARRRSDGSGSK